MKKDKKLRAKIQALENELNSNSKIKKNIPNKNTRSFKTLDIEIKETSNVKEIKIDIVKSIVFIIISFIGVYFLSLYIAR